MSSCPICQHAATVSFLRARDHGSGEWFELRQCARCETVFTVPPSRLDRYYHAAYRQYRPRVQQLFRWFYRRTARRWSRRYPQPGRALEAGCGEGWMLAALRDEGWRVVGTERTCDSARFARQTLGLPVMVGSLDALRPTASFDLIYMHHVLEHLPDPVAVLRQCAGLLRPGGALVLAVPNLASWQFRLSGRHWFHLDVPRHLTHFTPRTLASALQRVGLRVESVRYLSLDQDPFGWMVSLLNRLGFPQTRWLHWLAGQQRDASLVNLSLLALSPLLLAVGWVLAPLSWLFHAGACMEVRAVR